jgi:hypothetical protein
MSVSPLLGSAKPQYFDTTTGDFLVGGYIEFYSGGTSNPLDTYTTTVGNITNANPIYLNARGEPDNQINGTDGVSYKVILKDSTGTVIWTQDTIYSVNSTGSDTAVSALEAKLYLNGIVSAQSNYSIKTTDPGKLIDCTANSFTVSMLPVATAGSGFEVTVYNSGSGSISVDGSGLELINGAGALALSSGSWATLTTNGSYWKAIVATVNVVEASVLYLNSIDVKTANYIVVDGDRGKMLDCTSNSFTITLLASASAGEGYTLTVYNSGDGVITVDGNLAETINGDAAFVLNTKTWATIVSDGTNWKAISSDPPIVNSNPSTTASTFTKSSNIYLATDAPISSFDIDAVIGASWESIGPTGSSATNTWTALDNVDDNAVAVLLRIVNKLETFASGLTYTAIVYAQKTGAGLALNDLTTVSSIRYWGDHNQTDFPAITEMWVTVDSNGRFDMALSNAGATSTITMGLVGYAV